MSDYISVSRESLQKDQEKIKELEEKLKLAEMKAMQSSLSAAHHPLHSMGQLSLEREIEEKNRYIGYLEDKVNFHEGIRPSIDDVAVDDDRILYNVKVSMEKSVSTSRTYLLFKGVTEGGEVKAFEVRIQDVHKTQNRCVPLPGIILGLPE